MIQYEIRAADRLANERTFLAWIRTAISIIAFGFVVIKFLIPEKPPEGTPSRDLLPGAFNHAFFTGVSFVIMGAVISVLAYVRYRLADKQIVTGTLQNSFLLPSVLLFAILVICILLVLYFLNTAFTIPSNI